MSYTFFRNSIPVRGVEEKALWVMNNGNVQLVNDDAYIIAELDKTVFYQVEATPELCAMVRGQDINHYESPLFHGRIEFTCSETGELLRRIEAYKEGKSFENVELTPSIETGLHNHFEEIEKQFTGNFSGEPTDNYTVEMALKIDLRDDNPKTITRRSLYCSRETFAAIEKKLRQGAI